jgi:hypothetical protein
MEIRKAGPILSLLERKYKSLIRLNRIVSYFHTKNKYRVLTSQISFI